MSSSHPTYDTPRIHAIYDRIVLPPPHRHNPSDATRALARSAAGLEWLAALQRHHLATVPFESLELHYSPTKAITLDSDALFHKIVTQGTGRGGYCMENNAFFGTLLRSLGFQVMSTGGRVNTAASPTGSTGGGVRFEGWGHMLNIVTVAGRRYLVDVGFGAGGPTHPLLLEDGCETMNVGPNQRVRLRWDSVPESESEAQLWLYESQNEEGGEWNTTYCFPDGVEFLPQDYNVMNFYTSNSRTSFFTYKALCAKFVLDESGEEVVGTVVLFDRSAHKRIWGEKIPIATFETEEERVRTLKEWFGVTLSPAQRNGIRDMASAI